MAQVIKYVNLEVSKPNIFQALVAKQNDCNSRYLNVTLVDDGVNIPIKTTSTVTINANRADGESQSFKGTVNLDGTALVPIHAWMLATAGIVNCDVSVFDAEDHRLTSTTFLIDVEKAANADSEISEDENVGILTTLINECNTATTAANEALEIASSSFASSVICESSGETIVLSDATDGVLQGLTLYGKTTQDGTPTADVPIDLVNAGDDGDITMMVTGKNLISYPYYHSTMTTNGITFTDNGDGTITANGTSTSVAIFYMCNAGKTLLYLPQGTYSLSGCPQGGSASTYRVVVLTATGSGLYSDYGANQTVNVSKTRAEEGLRIALRIENGVTVENLVFKPMINLGSVVALYEPNRITQKLTIPTVDGLAGIPVTSGGDYTDADGQQWICDEVDFEKGVYVQRIGKVVFDGSTTLCTGKSASTNNDAFSFGAKSVYLGSDSAALAFGTHGVAISTAEAENGQQGYMVDSDGTLYMCLGVNSGASTVNDANYYLAQQYENGTPMGIQYVLAEPIETRLSDEELAAYAVTHTNYPNTIIRNDSGAGQQIKYMADTKIYIDNKFNELAAAIVNNT